VKRVLSDHDYNRLKQYLSFLQKDDRIVAAILHGSVLTTNQYQDIDLALITSDPSISEQDKLNYYLRSPENFDVRFLRDFPLYIAKEVIKGRLMLNKDYDFVFDTIINVIQEWELFRPSFELYMEMVLDGL